MLAYFKIKYVDQQTPSQGFVLDMHTREEVIFELFSGAKIPLGFWRQKILETLVRLK